MDTEQVQFRAMETSDSLSVAAIYGQGIKSGHATFEQHAPPWFEWDSGHLKKCRIVAVKDGEVVGWAALSAVSGRSVYAGVAEVSVYVSDSCKG
jgi:phosphinothricin acetyltransferase